MVCLNQLFISSPNCPFSENNHLHCVYTVVLYCILHITCFLQMSFRNVALVFGPTLVRGAAQDMLTSMNESYIIVEALCRHVSVESVMPGY